MKPYLIFVIVTFFSGGWCHAEDEQTKVILIMADDIGMVCEFLGGEMPSRGWAIGGLFKKWETSLEGFHQDRTTQTLFHRGNVCLSNDWMEERPLDNTEAQGGGICSRMP
jgi:hypothetical protein